VKLSFKYFCDPTFVRDLPLLAQLSKLVQNFGIVAGFAEDVDVFDRTPQARVRVDGESPSYHEAEFSVLENIEHFRIKGISRRLRIITHNFSIEKVTANPGIYRMAALLLAGLLAQPAQGQVCAGWKDAVHIGDLQLRLQEASGVAVSRKFPDRLYHINDSGDAGRFYITNTKGTETQPVSVIGFKPVDTEAVSLGACSNGKSCLFIGDIGDNGRRRQTVDI